LVDFEKYRESIRSKAQLGTLLQALYDTRNSLATDPKDKIYALLGLVSDGNTIAGRPNYTLALETMLKKITKNMLMREKNLNLIVVKSPNLTRTDHHPSWLSELTNLGNALLPWQEAYFNLPESRKSSNLEFIGDELFVTGIHKSAIASITTTSVGVTSENKAKARELSIERASPSVSHGLLFHTLARSPYPSAGTSSEYDKTVVSKFLTALGSDESQDYIKQNHPQWLDWLAKNGDFVVGNRRLRTYFEPPKRIERRGTKAWREARDFAAATTLLSTLPLWIVEEVKRRKVEPGRGSNSWQDKIERFYGLKGMEAGKTDVEHLSYLITEFERMLRFGLTLFTTSTGDIGMATSVAMKNDSIYEIHGCAKPIILRSCVDGWKVIGEAYFCKFDATPGKEQRLKLV
jgi:hypothetical protein